MKSEFSFSKTSCFAKAKEYSLSYYLPLAGEEEIDSCFSENYLQETETQTASSRVWTQNAVSVS